MHLRVSPWGTPLVKPRHASLSWKHTHVHHRDRVECTLRALTQGMVKHTGCASCNASRLDHETRAALFLNAIAAQGCELLASGAASTMAWSLLSAWPPG